MAENRPTSLDKLVTDFQAGRISRRTFLTMLAGASGAAVFGGVGEVFAQTQHSTAPIAARSASAQAALPVLVYGASQDISTIDPSDRMDYSINAILRQLYDRLFRFEGGWPQPIEPGLCQKWSVSADAKVWTFQLTDKAKFHDGSPVKASDVVYSYQRTLRFKKQRSSLLSGYLDESSIVAKDDTTVVMTLKTPYAAFDRLLAFLEHPIVSEAIVKKNDKGGDEGAAWLVDHEAGSGPFTIKNWQIGSVYEIQAVDSYWQGWPGKSHVGGVVWKKTEDPGTRKTGLLAGDFDVIDTVSTTDLKEINGGASTTATVNYGLLAGYFKLNTQTGPTADPNFRKFLAYSFNRKAFSDSQQGYVKLMTGPLPEGVVGYDAKLDPSYSYDPAKAKSFLDKTKYKDGGVSIDFVYVSGLDFEESAGLILLDEMKKYKITVNMVPKNWPDIVGACGKPDTGPNVAFIFDQFPPLADTWLIEKYSSASWDRPTGGSFQACDFYKNPAVDTLLTKLQTTTDATASAKLVSDLQIAISTDAPDIPVYVEANIVGFSKKVKGYVYYGDISVDFWRLWME